ncbi:MAG: tripartite tricarboxylate transporter substrate binding protein [Negativicutes bacterium]|nr:tripartite tricarboxylate transporter substrate binding protein [Negativicutes bacterium]
MVSGKKLFSLLALMVFAGILVLGCGGQKKEAGSKTAGGYPANNINGIITWGAGGVMDNVSRSITPMVEKELGKSIILANKPGATGAIAMQYVHDQKNDGYTLLYGAENPQLYKVLELSKLDYDDFEPIMLFGKGVAVLVAEKSSPLNSYEDLVKALRQNAGKFNMGATGAGGLPQVATALILQKENVKANFVNYDGEGPMVTALLGKQVDAAAISVGTVAQYIRTGDLKALALIANSPVDILPNVPVLGEMKPEYKESLKTFGPFYGVFVKKGTAEDVIKRLSEAFGKGYQDPKFQEFMKKSGIIPLGISGQEAKQYLVTWRAQHSWLLHDIGAAKISPERVGIPRPGK